MISSVAYLGLRCLLGCLGVLTRRQVSKDADCWSCGTRTRSFGARSAGSATSLVTGCGSRHCRDLSLAAAGVRCS